MDFFYFLVTGSKAWEADYHENFFNVHSGFLWGFVGALVIGVVFALAFYFGCCNNRRSVKSANIGVWAIFLIIAAAVGYFYADLVVIGDSATTDNSSLFRAHSFYKANDDYYVKVTSNGQMTQQQIGALQTLKNDIKSNLDKGGDVRFDFDLTTALLTILIYFLFSLVFKRFTINGKHVPFLKP